MCMARVHVDERCNQGSRRTCIPILLRQLAGAEVEGRAVGHGRARERAALEAIVDGHRLPPRA